VVHASQRAQQHMQRYASAPACLGSGCRSGHRGV
jgi:hypothetical protein